MRHLMRSGAVLAVAVLIAGGVTGADPLKSGHQPGDKTAIPFDPLHCNGPTVGQKKCLV